MVKMEPPAPLPGGFGNSNLKAWAMAVLHFAAKPKFWETLNVTLHPYHPSVLRNHL